MSTHGKNQTTTQKKNTVRSVKQKDQLKTETLDYDKSKWGEGPWQTEPDKAYWVDKKTGLDCLIVRNPMGGLCGYVGVPEGHKFYEKDYNDVSIDVHGGLTYSNHCQEKGPICHETEKEDKIWWLGFDCLHFGDFYPKTNELNKSFKIKHFEHESYKDFEYVEKEIARLARQLNGAD